MQYDKFATMFQRQATKYGNRICMKYRNYSTNKWIPISWNKVNEITHSVALAIAELGMKEQETIGVFSQNMPEYIYADFAAYENRLITVPIYATSSPLQTQYIVDDANISTLFVGEQKQYDTAFSIISRCKSLQHIVIFSKKVKRNAQDNISFYFDDFLLHGQNETNEKLVKQRTEEACEEDIACIMYTSGTTGNPKGVILLHKSFQAAFRDHDATVPIFDTDISLNFLPLTHIFEKAWTYLCLHAGATICINLVPQKVQQAIKEIRPTLMCSVPRFWEKLYAGVQDKINSTTGIKKKFMNDAIIVGKKVNIDYLRVGKKPPLTLRLRYKMYEKTIYSLLKETVGLENGRLFPIGGAKMSPEIHDFVHGVGLPILIGYGLTESLATVSFTDPMVYSRESVGFPLPHTQVKIGKENEILLKGDSITPGYYNNAKATAEAIDQEGWFHTGDSGYFNEQGELFLTERLKDLFKTSNGKYIAPQSIESLLVVDKYIDQITIIADQRKYASALIVPEYSLVKKWAEEHGLGDQTMSELLINKKILKLFANRIGTLQQSLAHYEQIKRFTLLEQPFSMERGEMTNTMKIKRFVIARNYADEINKMY
ncbi:MAG: long-chain fatty acid--CoA ligase [Bacteroidaceae bacterium]